MKAWLRKLIWMLVSAPIKRRIAWTNEERASFEMFCRSSTGQKFFELMRQTAATVTFASVYKGTASASGHARGMQDMLGLMIRLRASAPPIGAEAYEPDEDVEPLQSQKVPIDGRQFGSGGSSAINGW
jgi:hypothetical protein